MKYTIFILLALVPSITALICYDCNSLENEACKEAGGLTKEFEKTCPQKNDTYCRKIDQTINGEKSIVRSCGVKKGAKDCYKTAGTNSANVCSCNDRDLCNHAASLTRQSHGIITILWSTVGLAIAMIVLR